MKQKKGIESDTEEGLFGRFVRASVWKGDAWEEF